MPIILLNELEIAEAIMEYTERRTLNNFVLASEEPAKAVEFTAGTGDSAYDPEELRAAVHYNDEGE